MYGKGYQQQMSFLLENMYWKAALLGIVQGLTEFLPVSSTGHLVLAGKFLEIAPEESTFSAMFNIVVQLSSILAVVIYFRKQLLPAAFFKEEECRKETFALYWRTAVAVLPALGIGYLIKDHVEEWQKNPYIVAAALFIGGVILIFIEKVMKREKVIEKITDLPYIKAAGVGFFQCIAMIPGVSRSASTIIGGLALGLSRPLAAEFSFFLAIPTMAAASFYALLKHGGNLSLKEWIATAIGFIVSFLVSWGVIAWLMNFIRKRSFQVFGYYRIILAVIVVIYFLRTGK